jgi:hypothetical protein
VVSGVQGRTHCFTNLSEIYYRAVRRLVAEFHHGESWSLPLWPMGFRWTLRNLTLDRHRKARVWLDDLPEAAFNADQVIRFTVPATNSAAGIQRIAAIELMTPRGGMIMYALLGGQFTPDLSSVLGLSIRVADTPTAGSFKGTLVESFDDVRVGLPSEFVDGVVQGVHMALDATNMVSGTIVINCAAHAAVGSSIVAFRGVTRSLMHLFRSASLDLDDAELISAF